MTASVTHVHCQAFRFFSTHSSSVGIRLNGYINVYRLVVSCLQISSRISLQKMLLTGKNVTFAAVIVKVHR